MAPGCIFQIFLRVTVQNQIRIAQWVVVDEIIQFGLLLHGNIQSILNPGAVNGDFPPIPEQHALRVSLSSALDANPLYYTINN